jgi:serine/threonine-protein kinase
VDASATRLQAALADRYTVEREIGVGGMARVYLAEDLKHHRKVALKVLNPDLAAAIGADRFLREIEIAAGLTHPHILPVYDSGDADGLLYFVMPYVEGESLRQRLDRDQQLPIDEAVQIAREVAGALESAHRHGVIHRDVKPANILLEEGHAVVADFGIAKALAATEHERLTLTGVSVGTPQYMSPEQATGERTDARSDVYSLGAVLYEMLVGEPPHTGPNTHAIVAKLLTERPVRPRVLRETVPEGVDQALMKALAKAPADRYGTVAEFSDAMGGSTTEVTAVGQEASAPARTAGRWIAGAGAVALAALVLTVPFWRGPDDTGPSPPAVPDEGRPSVAALPFDNLSPNPEDAYFAAGVHGEILTHLARIAALKVISRTSVLEYEDRDRNLRQIADELGVTNILEGSVRRDGDRLRITVQLIDARTDEHLWGESYDGDLSDIFAVQSDVARSVAERLEASLAPDELARIDARPTQSTEAYAFYLRALEFGEVEEQREMLLEQAVQLDPDFALADAELATYHILVFLRRWDRAEDRLRAAKAALDRAFELDPDLPEAHFAAGTYYFAGPRDNLMATREFALATAGLPNAGRAHYGLATVLRRARRFEEALGSYRRAIELDPRQPTRLLGLAWTQVTLRRFDEAEETFARLLALGGIPPDAVGVRRPPPARPGVPGSPGVRAGENTPGPNRADVRRALEGDGSFIRLLALIPGDGERALRMLDAYRAAVPEAGGAEFLYAEAYLLVRDYRRAAEVVERVLSQSRARSVLAEAGEDPNRPLSRLRDDLAHAELLLGEIYALLERPELALAYYDSARVHLEVLAPDSLWEDHVLGRLAIAYAGLGRRDQAVETALEAKALAAFQQAHPWLARVYVMVGDFDDALDQIEWLLENPSIMNVGSLRAHPQWDPIRDHPRFQALLEKYGSEP